MPTVLEQVFAYVKKTYGVKPDRPFPNSPESPVLRHRDSRKWFGIVMEVPRERLGLAGEGSVGVLNLKCSPLLAGALREREGILPAYHMNREQWISVLLDGTVPPEEIFPLVDLSFELTASRGRPAGPVSWLVPANPKYYDLAAAIRDSEDGTFLWKQSSRVKPGDTVYIYVAAPVSGIRWKCRAVETDIPFSFADGPVRMEKVMRLKLRKTYRKAVGLPVLKEHGVSTVRGPRLMPDSLLEAMGEKKSLTESSQKN